MKKTQRKDAVRNIRKRIVSYLSVCLVVMLGVGGFLTTRYMGAGIEKRATEYYDDHSFKDYDFVSSLGISNANIEKIASADDVTAAEGVLQADGSVTFRGQKRNVTVISLTEKVSVPDLTEGRLPEGRDECIIGEDFAEVEGLKVGDKIGLNLTGLDLSSGMEGDEAETGESILSRGRKDIENKRPLYKNEFTITGLMHHPDYLRRKSVNTVTLPLSAFNSEVTENLYTRAFVRIKQPENAGMFTEAYFEETAGTMSRMEKLAEELEGDRSKEVKDAAYAYIDAEWAKAEKELEEAQAKIESGEAELDAKLADGQKKLNDAAKKLADEVKKYSKKLHDGEMTLAEYRKKLKDAKKQLAEKKKKLKQGKKELAEKKAELEEARRIFEKDIAGNEDLMKQIEYLAKNWQKEEIRDSDEYKEAEKAVAQTVVDNEDAISSIISKSADEKVRKAAKELEKRTGRKIVESLDKLTNLPVDLVITSSKDVLNGARYTDEIIKYLDDALKAIKEIRAGFDDEEKEIADYEKQIKDGEKKIADAEKQLKDGEKLLKQKEAELEEGRRKLNSEQAEAERKIKAGWDKYYSEKRKYENKLDEAKALLAENREEAEKKLAEAKAEVEKISCEWIVLDRRGNTGYVDMRTNINAIKSMGVVFGILFTIITAIVCFSTLVIMIDEQKPLVGTVKAFGFSKK